LGRLVCSPNSSGGGGKSRRRTRRTIPNDSPPSSGLFFLTLRFWTRMRAAQGNANTRGFIIQAIGRKYFYLANPDNA
jgi:hypothetical protein